MSFSAFANHVRNPAHPHRRRVSALRSCVQLYRPIGFEAGLSYLREVAGQYDADEAALLRALDALAASRRGWHEHQRRYDAERRAAKLLGGRRPRRSVPNPYLGPAVWYGAARPAARHAVAFWQRRRLPALVATHDPLAARLGVLAETCRVSGGELSSSARDGLTATADALRARLGSGLYADDVVAYFRTRDLLSLVHLLRTATQE
ncbi:hypothetical protein ACPPVO_19830 [Dactylosporangium sp. McL0621]|uniref:hypothetical protein n=1 Tax=Dactylosporangium sp. McL0621 TaxID=3415678 RepID=UPI003CF96D01